MIDQLQNVNNHLQNAETRTYICLFQNSSYLEFSYLTQDTCVLWFLTLIHDIRHIPGALINAQWILIPGITSMYIKRKLVLRPRLGLESSVVNLDISPEWIKINIPVHSYLMKIQNKQLNLGLYLRELPVESETSLLCHNSFL